MRKLDINPLIKYSVQQQIHLNGNVFGNICYRCNEGSLYLSSEKVISAFCCDDTAIIIIPFKTELNSDVFD